MQNKIVISLTLLDKKNADTTMEGFIRQYMHIAKWQLHIA